MALFVFDVLYEIKITIIPFVLIAGHSLSRFLAVSFLYTSEYARKNDNLSRSKDILPKMSLKEYLIAAFLGVIPICLLGLKYFIVLVPLIIIRQYIEFYLSKKINGFTGDTLGAVQQISEICFYIFIYLISRWIFI